MVPVEKDNKYYEYPAVNTFTDLKEYLPKIVNYPEMRHDVYFANPMSSYGMRVMYEKRYPGQDVAPFMADIIAQNNRFTETNVRLLEPEFSGARVIVPNRIGRIPGFQSLDYMIVCCVLISGFDQDSALEYAELAKKAVKPEIFNSHSKGPMSKAASLEEHHKLAGECANYFYGLRSKPQAIRRAMAIAGHEKSNGTDSELLLSSLIGVPIDRVTYDPYHRDYKRKILKAGPWLELYEDQSHLSPNGGVSLIHLQPYQHPKALVA